MIQIYVELSGITRYYGKCISDIRKKKKKKKKKKTNLNMHLNLKILVRSAKRDADDMDDMI